jgi:dTDP-4-dehydrorhamnose reductase
LALGNSIAIVRLTKVLGPRPGLLQGWLQSLQDGKVIHPFSDMVMAPVSLSFTTEVLKRLVQVQEAGIWQVSGTEDLSYAQIAQYLARQIDANLSLVQPLHSSRSGLTFEAVPSHTTLDTSKLQAKLGLMPPETWATLNEVVDF